MIVPQIAAATAALVRAGRRCGDAAAETGIDRRGIARRSALRASLPRSGIAAAGRPDTDAGSR